MTTITEFLSHLYYLAGILLSIFWFQGSPSKMMNALHLSKLEAIRFPLARFEHWGPNRKQIWRFVWSAYVPTTMWILVGLFSPTLWAIAFDVIMVGLVCHIVITGIVIHWMKIVAFSVQRWIVGIYIWTVAIDHFVFQHHNLGRMYLDLLK